jgi:threonine/homoserine/homoserine lactone efflux protein
MVFYLALVPTLIDVAAITVIARRTRAGCLLVLAVVFGAYIGLALRARRLFASPRALRRVNKVTGAVMAGAAVAVATR